MIYLSTTQLLFVIIVPIVVIALLVIFLAIPLLRKHNRTHFQECCYKTINKYVRDNDLYLINNYVYKIDDNRKIAIDHLLFSDKFIFVILDRFVEGSLVGKGDDPSFIHIAKDGDRDYVDNQFIIMNKILRSFAISTNLPTSFLIGITILNNDCKTTLDANSKQLYMVHKKELINLLKEVDSRDVALIDEEQLAKAVKVVAQSNKRK